MGNILRWFYFLRIFDQFGPKILDGLKAKKMFFFQNSKFFCLLYSPRPLVSEKPKNNAKTLNIESASSLKAAHCVPSENHVQLCNPITFDSLNEF